MGRRIFNIVLLALMIVGAAVTYTLKHKAEVAAERVARLESEIQKQKDALALLRAEWSVLTQPGQLQAVVGKYSDHFQLAPFSPEQIATIDEIGMRPVGGSSRPASAAAADAISDMITGSVRE